MTEGPRRRGDSSGIAVGADGRDDEGRGTFDHEGGGTYLLAGVSGHGQRLAREDRFVEQQRVARLQAAIGDDLIAWAKLHEVAADDVGDREPEQASVANHGRGRRDERGEAVEAALGANLLHDADAGVHDHNPQEERILGIAEHEGDDGERHENGVEHGEDVRDHDARVRAARRGRHRACPLRLPGCQGCPRAGRAGGCPAAIHAATAEATMASALTVNAS